MSETCLYVPVALVSDADAEKTKAEAIRLRAIIEPLRNDPEVQVAMEAVGKAIAEAFCLLDSRKAVASSVFSVSVLCSIAYDMLALEHPQDAASVASYRLMVIKLISDMMGLLIKGHSEGGSA